MEDSQWDEWSFEHVAVVGLEAKEGGSGSGGV